MNAWIIAKKELRDMFRDKRVVNGAFVMPVVMIVMFIMLIGFVEQKLTTEADLTVGITGDQQNTIATALEQAPKITIRKFKSSEEGVKKLRDGDIRVLLDFAPNFDANMAKFDAKITAHYLESEPLSQISLSVINKVVEATNKQQLKGLLKDVGLKPDQINSISLDTKDESKKEGIGGSSVVRLLPYLIILWAFYGGFSIVSDLVAGEKERGTMETLLISPVRRSDISFGKFIALSVICLTSSLSSLVAVVILGSLNLEMTKALFPTGMQVSLLSIMAMLAVLLPLVAFFSSAMIAISAYARNLREAQTYLTLFSFVVLMPAIFSQFVGLTGADKAAWVNWTPILNSAIAIKDALESSIRTPALLGAIATSSILAIIGFVVAARLFDREQIVTRV